MQFGFNAGAQRGKAATKGIQPRISRISRMRNPSCLIRAIREIRGKKILLQMLDSER
jgi:hypothetical protein